MRGSLSGCFYAMSLHWLDGTEIYRIWESHAWLMQFLSQSLTLHVEDVDHQEVRCLSCQAKLLSRSLVDPRTEGTYLSKCNVDRHSPPIRRKQQQISRSSAQSCFRPRHRVHYRKIFTLKTGSATNDVATRTKSIAYMHVGGPNGAKLCPAFALPSHTYPSFGHTCVMTTV